MLSAGLEIATEQPRAWAPDLYVQLNSVDQLHNGQRTKELVREVLRFARPSPLLLRRLVQRALVLFRPVATPNLEMLRFLGLAKSAGRRPVILELSQDWFTPTVNPAKRRLAKLAIGQARGVGAAPRPKSVVVTSFNEPGQHRFRDLRCLDGTPFVAFHHDLLRTILGGEVLQAVVDADPFVAGDGPRQHYERAFALYTCVGALAESFAFSGPEASFTEDVVLPALEATVARFGARPAIVELLPAGEAHEPYWDAYPPEALPLALRASGR